MSVPPKNKNQKIEALVKLVQKKSRGAGLCPPPPRSVLETLMFGAVLENASFDRANEAYAVLTNYYIDWNEIRVCTPRELADTISILPNPDAAAMRIRKSLQAIFEKLYVFDLEELRKKGKALAEHIRFLESIPAGSPYMIQYAAQIALDGHLVPMDEASLRIMRRLGLSQVSPDGSQEICVGLERVILKKSNLNFSIQLHHLAAEYFDIPDSPELLAMLSAIDPKAVERSWTAPVLIPASAVKKPVVAPVATATGSIAAKPPAAAEKPVAEKAAVGKTTAEKTVTEKAAAEKPVAGKGETKVAEKPVAGESKPAAGKDVSPSKPASKPKETPPPPVAKTAAKTTETVPPTKITAKTETKKPATPSPSSGQSSKKSEKPAAAEIPKGPKTPVKPELLSKTLRKTKPK